MAHPIRQFARLTTRTKQIDGMGFGGIACDNLEVAGALGLPNPHTKKPLKREAYELARLVYCMDGSQAFRVKASLLASVKPEAGKVKDVTLMKLCNSALREYIKPTTKLNKLGEAEITTRSNHAISREIGIDHSSFTSTHENLYRKAIEVLHIWSNEAVQHVNLCIEEKAA